MSTSKTDGSDSASVKSRELDIMGVLCEKENSEHEVQILKDKLHRAEMKDATNTQNIKNFIAENGLAELSLWRLVKEGWCRKDRSAVYDELRKYNPNPGWGALDPVADLEYVDRLTHEERDSRRKKKKFREGEANAVKFMRQFNFRKDGSLLVGIERECFITNASDEIVPRAAEILAHLPDRSRFGYELSASQIEDRVGPVKIDDLKKKLLENERDLERIEKKLGFKRLHVEVAPESMPLDVYPDPTGRYQMITKNMPQHILSAACRVTGTHVHIGMSGHETALNVYNKVIGKTDKLCALGDGSSGERLKIYKIMAPDFKPPYYDSWVDFYDKAVKKGFVADPRKCWHLIRISVHGTIEFRMFGATPDLDKIVGWARMCHQMCCEAIE